MQLWRSVRRLQTTHTFSLRPSEEQTPRHVPWVRLRTLNPPLKLPFGEAPGTLKPLKMDVDDLYDINAIIEWSVLMSKVRYLRTRGNYLKDILEISKTNHDRLETPLENRF